MMQTGRSDDFTASVGHGRLVVSPVGIRTRNVEPTPTVLETSTSPPMAVTMRRQIANPSPVPPNFRVVDWSACEKTSKIVESFSSGIPIPLSSTDRSISRRIDRAHLLTRA